MVDYGEIFIVAITSFADGKGMQTDLQVNSGEFESSQIVTSNKNQIKCILNNAANTLVSSLNQNIPCGNFFN